MSNAKEQANTGRNEWHLCYSGGLTLAKAKRMLNAAEAEARKIGLPMVIAITDAGGNLLAFHRMDNAMLCSIQIAMDKAYTAVLGKRPSLQWQAAFQSGKLPSLFFHERWTAFPGGFTLMRGNKIFGGVGASGGGAFEDISVARAALIAGGFATDDADAALAEIAKENQ